MTHWTHWAPIAYAMHTNLVKAKAIWLLLFFGGGGGGLLSYKWQIQKKEEKKYISMSLVSLDMQRTIGTPLSCNCSFSTKDKDI